MYLGMKGEPPSILGFCRNVVPTKQGHHVVKEIFRSCALPARLSPDRIASKKLKSVSRHFVDIFLGVNEEIAHRLY